MRIFCVSIALLVAATIVAQGSQTSKNNSVSYRLQDFLGKDVAWVEKKLGKPSPPLQWRPYRRSTDLGGKQAQMASTTYLVDRPMPNQLSIGFDGLTSGQAIVTHISWISLTNNHASLDEAAKVVGIRLSDYQELKPESGYPPLTKIFANKGNKRIRAVLFNANGSRWFELELRPK